MMFDSNLSILYSDTQVPDVFITEYMPSLEGDYLKVYLYCLFLNKRKKHATVEDISKKLEMDMNKVKDAFTCFENLGVISRSDTSVNIVDLKEKEIRKLYRPKTSSTPEEATLSSERNKKRSKFISDINNAFFQGVMSPSWYTDIDAWFDKYQFEEDVMFALFRHCYDHKGLSKQYIMKVADNWCNKNIKNSFDLDRYSIEEQKFRDIRLKIVKKLKKYGTSTEYEDSYIEKWVMEYKYNFDIIELALKKTTNVLNPSFEYINRIIAGWYEKGLRTKDEVLAEMEKKPADASKFKPKEKEIPQKGNFEQRKYDEEYFEKLYKDV